MNEFTITLPYGGERTVGGDAPCFVIAEVGTNWCLGDRNEDRHALALIDQAAEAGCDAVKFQTYAPERVYVATAGQSSYLAEAGLDRPIGEIIAERVMPPAMVPRLAGYAQSRGLVFMSSCFSEQDLALVDPLTPIHKLASYEISHLRLIDALAATGKPLILSTGASEEEDIAWAVQRFRSASAAPLALMQCTASYPAPDKAMNLRAIPWLARRFDAVSGLSDHSSHPLRAPLAAVALGAGIVEKHVTLDRSLEGPDHFNSIEADELAEMVAGIRAVEAMLGDGKKNVGGAEQELYEFARRGLQVTRDVAVGEVLREGDNLAILRPGHRRRGAHPRWLGNIDGHRARVAIASGDGIFPDMVD